MAERWAESLVASMADSMAGLMADLKVVKRVRKTDNGWAFRMAGRMDGHWVVTKVAMKVEMMAAHWGWKMESW